jgi:hypothetical protein
MVPARFSDVDAARARFGEHVDRLGPYLMKSDPLADAVVARFARMKPGEGFRMLDAALRRGIEHVDGAPDELRALFAEVDHVPFWVDWDTLDRGGRVLLRAGALGGMVLGAQSLVLGYASPAGNKPLVFSGRLREQAPRRLNETARFVHAVSKPGGMRRFAEGFLITVKVRIVHAQVRLLVKSTGRWKSELWGEPVNQHDMAGTNLLFSAAVLDGLDKLGCRIEAKEREDYIQLWRYVGHVIGVQHDILPTSVVEAYRLAGIIEMTQGEPDDDSRALTRALLDASIQAAKDDRERRRAERFSRFAYGLCRTLVGDELADKLGVPKTNMRHAIRGLKAMVAVAERARQNVPFAGTLAVFAGNHYWDRVVEIGLAGEQPEYRPPEKLAKSAA